jgi:iron(III) transport system substrate-binding protein
MQRVSQPQLARGWRADRRSARLSRTADRPGLTAGAPSARLRLTPALAALGIAIACAGCGGKGGPSIVLYNGQHSQLTNALIAAFEKQSGVSVEVRLDDSIVLADQILEEGHDSPADVYISENSTELMTLEQHGLLAKLPHAVLDQIPSDDDSPAGEWVGIALRVSALVYDPSSISRSELPRSILDLAQPRWKGKIAIAPTDSDFPPLVAAVLHRYGRATAEAWLRGLQRNAVTYVDEESVAAAVNRGDVAVGVVNQYYWYRLRLEFGASATHSALAYFPDDDVGSITNISGAAVLASSRNRTNAVKFVRFLVSRQGQEILAASDDFEYPARPDVKPNRALPPLDTISHATMTPAELGNDTTVAALIQQAGLY